MRTLLLLCALLAGCAAYEPAPVSGGVAVLSGNGTVVTGRDWANAEAYTEAKGNDGSAEASGR